MTALPYGPAEAKVTLGRMSTEELRNIAIAYNLDLPADASQEALIDKIIEVWYAPPGVVPAASLPTGERYTEQKLARMRAVDVREVAVACGLSTDGKKAEVIKRILDHQEYLLAIMDREQRHSRSPYRDPETGHPISVRIARIKGLVR